MDRTEGSNFIDIGGGRRGFQDQNAEAGVPGTRVTAAFLNSLQEEIMAVIENAGLDPDKANWQQLDAAIRKLAAKIVNDYNIPLAQLNCLPWLPIISLTQKTPPAKPAIGDMYVVPDNCNGEWSDKASQIAEWNGSKWLFSTAKDGHGIGLPDGSVYIKIGGKYVLLTDLLDRRYSQHTEPPASTFYVVGPSGNDKNSGLKPTAAEGFATIQGAVDALSSRYMTQGSITLEISSGTYKSVVVESSLIARWYFKGDQSDSDKVKIVAENVKDKSVAFSASSGTDIRIDGLSLYGVDSCLSCVDAGVAIYDCNITLTTPNGCGIQVWGGSVNIYNKMRVTGKGDVIFQAADGGKLSLGFVDRFKKFPVNILFNEVSASNAVFYAAGCAILLVASPVATFNGVPSGTAYGATSNAIINTWGGGLGIFPGTKPGYVGTGGQAG